MSFKQIIIFKRFLMIIIALVALMISALLVYKELSLGLVLPGCGSGSGCDIVFQSGWGSWFFVPVAALAVGMYVLVIGLLLNSFFAKQKLQRNIANYALVACAIAIFFTALWFIAIQLFVIGAICKYCMSVHILGLILALLIVIPYLQKSIKANKNIAFKNQLKPKLIIVMIALGIAGAAVLAVGETVSKAGQSRTLSYGHIDINVSHYPVIGSPNAKHIVVLFADYTCPFCRQMHHYLEAAVKHFGKNQLAIAIAPVPLDSKCNPYVKHTLPVHEGGCELAKIALSVWNIAPGKFAQMDRWLFAAKHKRTTKQALKKAQQLVGKNVNIKKVMQEVWLKDFLQAQIQLNFMLGKQAKVNGTPVGDKLPKLIFSDSFMEVGVPASKQDFFNELKKQLQINN